MNLKITGLKLDTGEELSGKALSQQANLMEKHIGQEEDPKKKKRLEEKAKSLTLSNILFFLYIINFQLRIVEMLWRIRKIYFFFNKECKLFGTPVRVPIDLLTPPFEHLKTQSLKFEFVFNKFFFIDYFRFMEELATRIIETPNININPQIVVKQGFIDNYFESGI